MKIIIFVIPVAVSFIVVLFLSKLLRVEKLPGNVEGLDRYMRDNRERIKKAQTEWSKGTITQSEKRWLLRLAGMSTRVKVRKSHKNEGEVA